MVWPLHRAPPNGAARRSRRGGTVRPPHESGRGAGPDSGRRPEVVPHSSVGRPCLHTSGRRVRRGRLRQNAGLSARQSGWAASGAAVAGRACTSAAIVLVTCASGCHSSSSVQWASQKTPSSRSTRAATPERVSFVGPFMGLLFPKMRMSTHATFRGCQLTGSHGARRASMEPRKTRTLICKIACPPAEVSA